MPKKYRISHADFKLIEDARFRRERGAYFSLSHGRLSGARGNRLRVACVVSKKVAIRAVDRNFVKRRCLDAVRNLLAGDKEPFALIFYANKNAKTASFEEMKADINKLIEKSLGQSTD